MDLPDAPELSNKQLMLTIMAVSATMVVMALYFPPPDGAPAYEMLAFLMLSVGLVGTCVHYCYEGIRRHLEE